MRKISCLLLILMLVFAAFTGCKQNEAPGNAATEGTVATTDPTASETTPCSQEPTVDPEKVPFTPIVSSKDYFDTALFSPTDSAAKIQYLFHRPIRDTGKAYPLIIYLHGKGETLSASNLGTGQRFINTLIDLENYSEQYSAYTLVPITPLGSEGWWLDWQFDFLRCLIDRLVRTCNIDAKRIYITGISMGGYTTCRLLKEMPADTFAAAVPLSGAYTMDDPVSLYNTAFRIYHAANDPVVNVSHSRDLYQQLLDCKHPNVEYFEEEYGSHTSTLQTAYGDPNFYFWLFAQKLP